MGQMASLANLKLGLASSLTTANAVVSALSRTSTRADLAALMYAISRDLGFRHYALIHHADLRGEAVGRVKLLDYPSVIEDRIINQATWRRDPVIRGCIFAQRAFCWSELPALIELDRHDQRALVLGAQAGLANGITVPYNVHGECAGSCTFARKRSSIDVRRRLGIAQMIGIFAFQAAKRILVRPAFDIVDYPRLQPRQRDCVVLAGRGLSNKEIARALNLTPWTVDGYLREARQAFDAHDRTELVVSALLAGEIGLHELRRDQPA